MIFLQLLLMMILPYWFAKEIKKFPFKINQQVFQEYHQLINQKSLFYDFIKHSTLQYKEIKSIKWLYLLFPIILLVFKNEHFIIIFILSILIYLSILDLNYYLTDIKYIIIIFISGMIYLIFYKNMQIDENIFSLLFSIIFFFTLHFISEIILRKELLGMGDSLLIIALSPLFNLEQLLQLLLYASSLGILFASGYFFIKKCKIQCLPFIPFISCAFFILFMMKNY
ncbi:prepilin peptidase [Pasteurella atlantica]|uniref:prepilin peptidase n=1 Tax=Pasteurellaceae TaxID=712 RepID=UPI00276E76FC|nr:prepilin peptidase [Pasteurella atlantica]MDP8033497.1 prepilin peptidase [Pasteurella atlantica]MDP8035433.1 prepilin peptidase [Pasteurella atlantica]MDP8037384.1 prepilin peptidase [Pasteurella atlantica]MDP8047732.1 prepilin peptidase [Pasteurella atlantica]MDP8049707.1 prepilin peptidase [Pasteurella atlantica]